MIDYARWVFVFVLSVFLSQTTWSQSATILADFRDPLSLSQMPTTDGSPGFVVVDPDNQRGS